MGSGGDGDPLLGECARESGTISVRFVSSAQQVISGAVVHVPLIRHYFTYFNVYAPLIYYSTNHLVVQFFVCVQFKYMHEVSPYVL